MAYSLIYFNSKTEAETAYNNASLTDNACAYYEINLNPSIAYTIGAITYGTLDSTITSFGYYSDNTTYPNTTYPRGYVVTPGTYYVYPINVNTKLYSILYFNTELEAQTASDALIPSQTNISVGNIDGGSSSSLSLNEIMQIASLAVGGLNVNLNPPINSDYKVGSITSGTYDNTVITWTDIEHQISYQPNDELPIYNDYTYCLYPTQKANVSCFLEGTKLLASIDNVDTYVPIESLRKGDLIQTNLHGYKKIHSIGKGTIDNPTTTERSKNRLYVCKKGMYPVTEDLYITGGHSILVDTLTPREKEMTIQQFDRLFVTDNKYRLMACVDERAEPWSSAGKYTIWHIALEHEDTGMNYGIYANGLLVESCSICHLLKKMTVQ